jgi:cell division protease FtsH
VALVIFNGQAPLKTLQNSSLHDLYLIWELMSPSCLLYQGVLFLAATNRVEILDPALLRPGRINRKVRRSWSGLCARQSRTGWQQHCDCTDFVPVIAILLTPFRSPPILQVVVPLPDEAGRRDILAVHLRTTPMSSEEDKAEACERLARVTAGFSGAGM